MADWMRKSLFSTVVVRKSFTATGNEQLLSGRPSPQQARNSCSQEGLHRNRQGTVIVGKAFTATGKEQL